MFDSLADRIREDEQVSADRTVYSLGGGRRDFSCFVRGPILRRPVPEYVINRSQSITQRVKSAA